MELAAHELTVPDHAVGPVAARVKAEDRASVVLQAAARRRAAVLYVDNVRTAAAIAKYDAECKAAAEAERVPF